MSRSVKSTTKRDSSQALRQTTTHFRAHIRPKAGGTPVRDSTAAANGATRTNNNKKLATTHFTGTSTGRSTSRVMSQRREDKGPSKTHRSNRRSSLTSFSSRTTKGTKGCGSSRRRDHSMAGRLLMSLLVNSPSIRSNSRGRTPRTCETARGAGRTPATSTQPTHLVARVQAIEVPWLASFFAPSLGLLLLSFFGKWHFPGHVGEVSKMKLIYNLNIFRARNVRLHAAPIRNGVSGKSSGPTRNVLCALTLARKWRWY